MRKATRSTALLILASVFGNMAAAQNIDDLLPSEATRMAIASLEISSAKALNEFAIAELARASVQPMGIDPRNFDGRSPASLIREGNISPFIVPNTFRLLFDAQATGEQIRDLISRRELKVVETAPEIGEVLVETDLTRYFPLQREEGDWNKAVFKSLSNAVADFTSEPGIASAGPVFYVNLDPEAGITELDTESSRDPHDNTPLPGAAFRSETQDWGISDIQADQLWTLPGASDGVILGIFDSGFTRHEDLAYLRMPAVTPRSDHGTHVAGIACAKHNDRGVRGVLPSCLVHPQAPEYLFPGDGLGSEILELKIPINQVIDTLKDFISASDYVDIFNISLSYNWQSNLRADAGIIGTEDWRTAVESDGVTVLRLLAKMQEQNIDKVIVTAAGNSTFNLPAPDDAQYASPFNWGIIEANKRGILKGLIVEAHDANSNILPGANLGGQISCPGVGVISTIGSPGSGPGYGIARKNGTSFATPYCAAGLALFKLVRPDYTYAEAITCITGGSARSSSRVPMLKLKEAIDRCPPKDAGAP